MLRRLGIPRRVPWRLLAARVRLVFEQLDHAPWNGWTFTDLVFPFFLWIVGVSMTLSKRPATFTHVARRGALIFLIGFAINFTSRWSWGWYVTFPSQRWHGVPPATLKAGRVALALSKRL